MRGTATIRCQFLLRAGLYRLIPTNRSPPTCDTGLSSLSFVINITCYPCTVATMPSLFKLSAVLLPLISAVAAYTGDLTFFTPGLGACGLTNSDADMIAAVSVEFYNTFPGATANPNLNPICGKMATVNYGGKTIRVAITDKCYACALYDLDLSPTAFNMLADPSIGRLHGAEWTLDGTTPPPTTTPPPPPPTTTTPPPPPPTTTSPSGGSCAGVAPWSSSVAYTGGQQVTYNGHLWTAKWWTQADTPGGVAGVWTDNGACSAKLVATAQAVAVTSSAAPASAPNVSDSKTSPSSAKDGAKVVRSSRFFRL
ncbi:putative lytic transglycolase [Lyophyllum shimeji]|uniref:Lytic transglycolase n=1 Tax=Lyophyllum shimeji TaxID=47721 RepID=A0A9P3PK39_LYOSH|nr:putative lytic transglycolase [Lyophyllum shimeji]